jgi:F-box protein 39
MIRERISTATVLLLARTAANLQYFYVRKSNVLLECEWPQNPDWCDGFYDWLCESSRSYEETEKEVSQILQTDWKFLTDDQFQKVSLKKHINF